MAILITGAAGFIGSHLCDYFLNNTDQHVIGIDNFNSFYDPAIKHNNLKSCHQNPNFTLITGDILDKDTLTALFRAHNITTIFHLAAMAGVRPSIENPELYYSVNVMGFLNLLECAKEFKTPQFIFASSSSVYGSNEKAPFSETDRVESPVSPYAVTKRAGELMAYNYHQLYNIPMACVRFFTVYGPRQRPEMAIHKFTRLIDNGQPIPVFNQGECYRDYTYIDDIIQGLIGIYSKKSPDYDIVNLGGADTISTLNLIKLIETHLGKSAQLNLMPAQDGDVEKTYADIAHAQDIYGYSPEYPIEKGVQSFVAWYQEQTHSVAMRS